MCVCVCVCVFVCVCVCGPHSSATSLDVHRSECLLPLVKGSRRVHDMGYRPDISYIITLCLFVLPEFRVCVRYIATYSLSASSV